jgi:SAM-dependent methyltransferase
MTTNRDEGPLQEMNPTGRFTDRAADYVKYRPTYPAAAIDAVLRGMADPARLVAADVGAGTGISARLLADRGVRVIAVEPNAAMRLMASAHQNVEWRDGAAETTGLSTESVDLVLCAQAFHWFRQCEAVREFHRISRPGGRLVLMWNNRDARDAMTRGYIEAIHAVNGEHPAEQREFDPEVIHDEGRFTLPRLETFEHWQALDHEGLIGRALSASYVRREGQEFEVLKDLLAGLFERHRDVSGFVRLRYVTKVYVSDRQ